MSLMAHCIHCSTQPSDDPAPPPPRRNPDSFTLSRLLRSPPPRLPLPYPSVLLHSNHASSSLPLAFLPPPPPPPPPLLAGLGSALGLLGLPPALPLGLSSVRKKLFRSSGASCAQTCTRNRKQLSAASLAARSWCGSAHVLTAPPRCFAEYRTSSSQLPSPSSEALSFPTSGRDTPCFGST